MTTNPHTFSTAALLLALSLCGVNARAQGTAAETESARRAFDEGAEAAANGDFDSALDAFQRSFALKPKPVTQHNVAMCLKALHRYAAAIAAFELFLELDASGKGDTALLEDAREALAELEPLVGRVGVDGAPDGATLAIDGAAMATLPLAKPLVLEPGRYLIRITASGFVPFETAITCAAGAFVTVRARLEEERDVPDAVALADGLSNEDVAAKSFASPDPEASDGPTKRAFDLRIAGISSVALGGALGVIGLAFNLVGEKHARDAELAEQEWTLHGRQEDWDEFYEIKNEKLPAERAGMIVGYAAGAAFVAAGVILLAADAHREGFRSTPRVALGASGVGVSF